MFTPYSSDDKERARSHLNQAVDLRIAGKDHEAAEQLSRALALDPALADDSYVRELAAVVTRLPAESAIAKLGGVRGTQVSGRPGKNPALNGLAWTCSFCGSTNTASGDDCPSCGAARPANEAGQAAGPTGPINKETISISDIFLLNPAHKNFLLGKSRKLEAASGFAGGCLTLFMVPFVLVGIGVIIFAAVEWNKIMQINRSSVTAQAEVIDRRNGTDSDGDDYYKVTYRFYVQDRAFRNERNVNASQYKEMTRGSRVPIVYARADPTISYLQGENQSSTPLFATFFGVCWNGFVFLLIGGALVNSRRNKRLEREGALLKGTVVEASGYEDSDNDYNVKLKYAFRTPNGKEIVRQESHTRNDMKSGKTRERLPLAGTQVAVLFADDTCFKVM